MARAINRDRQLFKSDISFGLMAAFGVFGIAFLPFKNSEPTIASLPPLLVAMCAIGLTGVIALGATRIARIDRSYSEEYTFRILSAGAVVAVFTTMIVTLLSSSDILLERWLGTPSPGRTIATLMASWSLGYFTYRAKGVAE